MKACNACLPCMLGQAYNTAVLCTADPVLQKQILDEALRTYAGRSLDDTPAVLSQLAYELCRSMSGVDDPYAEPKRLSNEAALRLYPGLRDRLRASSDPLGDALLLAVAGNIIDLAIAQQYDLQEDIINQISEVSVTSLPPSRRLTTFSATPACSASRCWSRSCRNRSPRTCCPSSRPHSSGVFSFIIMDPIESLIDHEGCNGPHRVYCSTLPPVTQYLRSDEC